MFTCGTGNFAHMDHDEAPPPPSSAPSTPKGSPKAASKKKHHNKNPYATRGLDKFSMVLAELETRREKIIAKTGAQGVEIIRFMYDNSQDWVPIIVRPREGRAAGGEADQAKKLQLPPPPPEASEKALRIRTQEVEKTVKDEDKEEKKKVVVLKKPLGLKLRWRDEYYWPAVMVLILVCLVMFGRAFAICCTSIWWYAMPTMKERSVVRKKQIGRRLSDKRLGKNFVVQTAAAAAQGKKTQGLGSPKARGNEKKG